MVFKRLLQTTILVFIHHCSWGFAASPILERNRIRFYPAVKEGDKIFVPLKEPPDRDIEVVLLHGSRDVSRLKKIQEQPEVPKSLATEVYDPDPHYVFALAEGERSYESGNFLVAVGREPGSIVRWKDRTTMVSHTLPTECMGPDPGFSNTRLEVVFSEELQMKIYYAQSLMLQSTFDNGGRRLESKAVVGTVDSEILQFTFDNGAPRLESKAVLGTVDYEMLQSKFDKPEEGRRLESKAVVGIADKVGQCKVLAHYAYSDGPNTVGNVEAIGPLYGIVELTDGQGTEKWMVLDSGGYECDGYTFVEMPATPLSKEEMKTYFLVRSSH